MLYTKKLLSLLLCFTIMCSFLVSCDDTKPMPQVFSSDIQKDTADVTTGYVTKSVANPSISGELNISIAGDSYFNLKFPMIVDKFEELYPKVKLNINNAKCQSLEDYDAYNKNLISDLALPNKVDLFISSGELDMFKLMETGALADLSSHFNNDINFSIDDYNEAIFNGGQPSDKQYIVPLSYSLPLYMTTDSIADATDFDVSKCTDYLTTINEINHSINMKTNTANPIFYDNILNKFPLFSGIDYLNVDKKSTSIDSPKIKNVLEIYKSNIHGKSPNTFSLNEFTGYDKLIANEALFFDFYGYPFSFLMQSYRRFDANTKPIVFPLKDISGKIQAYSGESIAVNKNSNNIDIAYLFVKMLISPEIQSFSPNGYQVPSQTPVSNYALNEMLKTNLELSTIVIDSKTIVLQPISQEFIQQYMSFAKEAYIFTYDNKGHRLFMTEMMPYLNGEKSYEECISRAQATLNDYAIAF